MPATQQALTEKILGLLPWGFDREFNFKSKDNQETYLVKLDWNAAENHHISLRHNYSDYNNFPERGHRSAFEQW